jgi:hypothetical protein
LDSVDWGGHPLAMALLPDAIIEIPNEVNVGTIFRFCTIITSFMMSAEDFLGFLSEIAHTDK